MSSEFEQIKEERAEFKIRYEQKEKEQSWFESKIKSLEKLIRTNLGRSPVLDAQKPLKDVSLEANEMIKEKTPLSESNKVSSVKKQSKKVDEKQASRLKMVEDENASLVQQQTSTFRSSRITQTTTTHAIDITSQLANYNQSPDTVNELNDQKMNKTCDKVKRFKSPNIRVSQTNRAQENEMGLKSDGVPIANRRQRRSQSIEQWLDHRPASVAKLG
jgi:hypothetical protein